MVEGGTWLTRRHALAGLASGLAYLGLPKHASARSSLRAGLVYEDSERFSAIYQSVLRGLDAASDDIGSIKRHLLRPGITGGEIEGWLADNSIDEWVLIGKRSCDEYRRYEKSRQAFTALTFIDPTENKNLHGVSLEFDPERVLQTFKRLFPSHDRVHVVFRLGRDDWLNELAKNAADRLGVDLIDTGTRDLQEATETISNILRFGNPRTDCLWLLGAPGITNADTAPTIIERAWRARFPVFTGRRGDVDRGFLLSAEPNFVEMGKQLASVVGRASRDTSGLLIEPTKSLRLVLNVRTARRVGLEVTPTLREQIDVLVGDD
ncbi:MAG: hypothetical protein AAFV69_00205 [Pseudomonadota bacterium]